MRAPLHRRPFAPAAFRASVAALIAVCGLGCGEVSESGAAADAHQVAVTPALVDGKLDPTPYRAEIEKLEGALYLTRREKADDYETVGALVLELVNAIGATDSSRIGRVASGKLLFFSAQAQTGNEDPLIDDLTIIQQQWEELRGEYFAPASWYRHGADDSVPVAGARVPDSGRMAAIERVVSKLEELVSAARLEVVALGEPKYTLESIDDAGKAQISQWQRWSRAWDQRVAKSSAGLPEYPGPNAPSDLLSALERVDVAVIHLERVDLARGAWATPFRKQWEEHFEKAEFALREARRYLPVQSSAAPSRRVTQRR